MESVSSKVSAREQTHLQEVKVLVDRRAKRDEPTAEEWLAVETAIDEARANQDSQFLQDLDRFIERMDASDKAIREEAVTKIERP